MARRKRRLVPALLLLILLMGALVATAPLVPLDPLKPALESRLSGIIGRPVAVGGIRLSLLGGPYIIASDVTASEEPGFGSGEMLKASQLKADIELRPLILRREISIEGLEIQAAQLVFTKNERNVWSWTTIGASGRSEGTAAWNSSLTGLETRLAMSFLAWFGRATSVDKIEISDASVRLIDRSKTEPAETLYRGIDLSVRLSDVSPGVSRAEGVFRAHATDGEEAEPLDCEMPFDITIERSGSGVVAIDGRLGPGQLATRNFAAESFKSELKLKDGIATLDRMEMKLYDGEMRGRLELSLDTQRFNLESEVMGLNIDHAFASKLNLAGQVRGNVDAKFRLSGLLVGFQRALATLNGDGRFVSRNLLINSVNVSEHVARAAGVAEIGDMTPGTSVAYVESGFRIDQGTLATNSLKMLGFDGLGDASSERGSIRITFPPQLNYSATLVLSPEATARLKSGNSLIGMAAAMFARRSSVPVHLTITGAMQDPKVQVDTLRYLE